MKLLSTFVVPSEGDLDRSTKEVLAYLKPGHWVQLVGDLGAGKTTFVRKLLFQMGYSGSVVSPTYPLLVEYELEEHRIVHIDGFRLDGKSADPWDWKDWADAIVFVEWAENTRLPKERFSYRIEIKVDGCKRIISFFSVKGLDAKS
jgi:tRNA threonylcarbamoyladenosine biosynthesis protein TsaE